MLKKAEVAAAAAASVGHFESAVLADPGTLDKLCLGTGDTSAGVLRAVNSDQQNQQCSDTSTWATRDASLSHLLDNLSTLSANTGS